MVAWAALPSVHSSCDNDSVPDMVTACCQCHHAVIVSQEHYYGSAFYKLDALTVAQPTTDRSMICKGRWTMASTEREPITWVWGRSPQQGTGAAAARAPGRGTPVKLKAFCPCSFKRGAKSKEFK